jgi:hypothetical protein
VIAQPGDSGEWNATLRGRNPLPIRVRRRVRRVWRVYTKNELGSDECQMVAETLRTLRTLRLGAPQPAASPLAQDKAQAAPNRLRTARRPGRARFAKEALVPAIGNYVDRFVARLRARLIAGAAIYGNASFTRPAPELVDEVQEELEDVCGWSLLLWIRLERLRQSVEATGQGGTDGQ